MTRVVPAHSRAEAWLLATEALLLDSPQLNLILSIESPLSDGATSAALRRHVNSFYAEEKQFPLHTIAETIFPAWEYRHRGLDGMFETYAAEYDLLKKGDPTRWGTYAHRLLARRVADGTTVNPLKILISKMRNEIGQTGRGTYRSCYEVGMAEGEYDIPLFSTIDDEKKRRNLPCLSHLSFKLWDGHVHLTAVYRSHDYRYKTLGNLLGLARLQACVAQEVGAAVGSLVVHSTYAYVDTARGVSRLRKLVADVRNILAGESEHGVVEAIR